MFTIKDYEFKDDFITMWVGRQSQMLTRTGQIFLFDDL